MITRMQRLATSACLVLAMLALAPLSRADDGSFLELVPDGAPMAIYTPNYGVLEAKIDGLYDALGLMAPKLSAMRQVLGVESGLNTSSPIGMIFLSFDPASGEEPEMVLIAGFTDYAALVTSLGGEAEAGITEIALQGEPMYAKKLTAGYVALAPDSATLEGFTPDAKAGSARLKKLPAGVLETAEKSAASIVIFDMQPIMQAYEQAMKMAMMMGGPGMGQAAEQQQAVKEIAAQIDVLAIGMNSSQLGVNLDLAAGFKEGSELYGAAKKLRATGPLIRNAPAGEFLFAMGMDGGAFEMLKPLQELSGQQAGMDAAWAMIEQCTAQETAVYMPPSGLIGGLLTKTVTISYCKDPEKAYQAATDAIMEMDGTEQQGMKTTTSLQPDAAQIAGRKAAKYSFNFILPPEMQQASQGMMMMFGGLGPRGFIIPTKNAVVQTMGTDEAFAAQVVSRLEGEAGETLASSGAIQSIGKLLPAGRVVEGYLGVGALAKMVAPMAGMFLGIPIDVPADMPPVGFAMTVGEGEMGGTAFVPMQLMTSVKEMIDDLQQATQEMDDMEYEEEDEEFPF